MYLTKIGWIKENQTWRNLSSSQKEKIKAKLDSFITKAKDYVMSLEQEEEN